MSDRSQTKVKWWQSLLLIALVAAGIWIAYLLVRTSVRTFRSLDNEVAAAIITGFTALAVAVAGAAVSRQYERRANADRAQQERRVPVYEGFVQGLLRMMGATVHPSKRKEMDEREVVALLGKFTEEILVWGSDDVLKKWVEFRYKAMEVAASAEAGAENLYRLEDLFLAFRRDLGLSNRKLARGDLLRLFVNDLAPGETLGRPPHESK